MKVEIRSLKLVLNVGVSQRDRVNMLKQKRSQAQERSNEIVPRREIGSELLEAEKRWFLTGEMVKAKKAPSDQRSAGEVPRLGEVSR